LHLSSRVHEELKSAGGGQVWEVACEGGRTGATLAQQIPTRGAAAVEHFRRGSQSFLAFAQWTPSADDSSLLLVALEPEGQSDACSFVGYRTYSFPGQSPLRVRRAAPTTARSSSITAHPSSGAFSLTAAVLNDALYISHADPEARPPPPPTLLSW